MTNIKTYNVFSNIAESDGITNIGASESFFGAGQPVTLRMTNPGGATTVIRQRRSSSGDSFSEIGERSSREAESIVMMLVGGYEYQFYALALGTERVDCSMQQWRSENRVETQEVDLEDGWPIDVSPAAVVFSSQTQSQVATDAPAVDAIPADLPTGDDAAEDSGHTRYYDDYVVFYKADANGVWSESQRVERTSGTTFDPNEVVSFWSGLSNDDLLLITPGSLTRGSDNATYYLNPTKSTDGTAGDPLIDPTSESGTDAANWVLLAVAPVAPFSTTVRASTTPIALQPSTIVLVDTTVTNLVDNTDPDDVINYVRMTIDLADFADGEYVDVSNQGDGAILIDGNVEGDASGSYQNLVSGSKRRYIKNDALGTFQIDNVSGSSSAAASTSGTGLTTAQAALLATIAADELWTIVGPTFTGDVPIAANTAISKVVGTLVKVDAANVNITLPLLRPNGTALVAGDKAILAYQPNDENDFFGTIKPLTGQTLLGDTVDQPLSPTAFMHLDFVYLGSGAWTVTNPSYFTPQLVEYFDAITNPMQVKPETAVAIIGGDVGGVFVRALGDQSALVAIDPKGGVNIPIGDATGQLGVMIREYESSVNAAWFGVVYDGVEGTAGTVGVHSGTNSLAEMQAAHDYVKEVKEKRFHITGDAYIDGGTLNVTDGVKLDGQGNQIFTGLAYTADESALMQRDASKLSDIVINQSRGFLGIGLEVVGGTTGGGYVNGVVNSNTRVTQNYAAGQTLTGRGIVLNAEVGTDPVSFCQMYGMKADNMDVALELRAGASWCNSNSIEININNVRRGAQLLTTGGAACNKNTISVGQQVNTTQDNYDRLVYCESEDNTLIFKAWDWDQSTQSIAVEFSEDSSQNKVEGLTNPTLIRDLGYNNKIESDISRYYTESRASLPSFGEYGTPLGNYDNLLLEAFEDANKDTDVKGDAFTSASHVRRIFHPDNLAGVIPSCTETRLAIDLGQQVNGCKMIGAYFLRGYVPDTVEFLFSDDSSPMVDQDAANWTTFLRELAGTQRAFIADKRLSGANARHLQMIIKCATPKEIRIGAFFASFSEQINAPIHNLQTTGELLVQGGEAKILSPNGNFERVFGVDDTGSITDVVNPV